MRRRERNLARKAAYKKEVKQYEKLIAARKRGEAKELLPAVYKALDKAAKAGVIKKNKARRLKSRLAAKLVLGQKT